MYIWNAHHLLNMDTDSLNSISFRDAIDPCKRLSYDHALLSFCNEEVIIVGNGDEHWLARTCCQRHNAIDMRTPGLFKVEFEGTEMIALCSKTYLITSSITNKTKYSSKGVNKTDVFPFSEFRSAIFDRKYGHVVNRGMRGHNNKIFSYVQRRLGYHYFYCKRIVLDDGVSTKPLGLVLEPSTHE